MKNRDKTASGAGGADRRYWDSGRSPAPTAPPADGLTKDLIARMIAYRAQEEAFGGLDRQTLKLMDRLARGGKAGSDPIRRFKAGTVLVREHGGVASTNYNNYTLPPLPNAGITATDVLYESGNPLG